MVDDEERRKTKERRIPATCSLRCKMTHSFMSLIITCTVAKETWCNNNMILQQGYWDVSQPSSFWQEKYPWRMSERGRCASDAAVSFEGTRQINKAKCCGRAAILQMYFWRELRRLRPRSPFSGWFLIRNYFFQDSSIFSSTGRVFKSNSPVLTHPMVSGLIQVPRAPLQ